jgi:hypothetical protein
MAVPMPRLAPVTTATFPANSLTVPSLIDRRGTAGGPLGPVPFAVSHTVSTLVRPVIARLTAGRSVRVDATGL